MSTELQAEQINYSKYEEIQEEEGTDLAQTAKTSTDANATGGYRTGCWLPRKQRERRNKSPIAISTLLETFAAPLSPASSSCTSLGNSSADATFEPSVDMMVNDFDDEQTLNEEEALAAIEQQDPHDEIATLQEEGDMPLEELLAKYQVAPPGQVFVGGAIQKKKNKKTAGSNKQAKHRKLNAETTTTAYNNYTEGTTVGAMTESVVNSEQDFQDPRTVKDALNEELDNDEELSSPNIIMPNYCNENDDSLGEAVNPKNIARNVDNTDIPTAHVEKAKPRRTHLMDLYPEESFTEVPNSGASVEKDDQLQQHYNDDEDDEGEYINEVEDEEDAFVSDYVKKTIMVGPLYQATIPDGLSQYGDVLPYENEDKLIWEPSQVSERLVEEYLLKARDIKPSLLDNADDIDGEESNQTSHVTDVTVDTATIKANGIQIENKESITKNVNDLHGTIPATAGESVTDGSAVIKDNEQALHLLVQCGYDFKEALRRKRLNALPLTGTMSLWSEEECHKFEEGIQKFGKDFLKIRQNQVRTRTMRELVQFYYIWKKSDRRDHNFANSDTVDHMDIYLNEGGDYNPTTTNVNGSATTGSTNTTNLATTTLGVHKKNNACVQKNSISIMMSGNSTGSAIASSNNITPVAAAVITQTTTAPSHLNSSSSNNKATINRKRSVGGVSVSNYENTLAQVISLAAAQMK